MQGRSPSEIKGENKTTHLSTTCLVEHRSAGLFLPADDCSSPEPSPCPTGYRTSWASCGSCDCLDRLPPRRTGSPLCFQGGCWSSGSAWSWGPPWGSVVLFGSRRLWRLRGPWGGLMRRCESWGWRRIQREAAFGSGPCPCWYDCPVPGRHCWSWGFPWSDRRVYSLRGAGGGGGKKIIDHKWGMCVTPLLFWNRTKHRAPYLGAVRDKHPSRWARVTPSAVSWGWSSVRWTWPGAAARTSVQ